MLCHFFFSFLISFVFSKNALVVVFPFYQNKNLDLAELIRTTVNETNVSYDILIEQNEGKKWKKQFEAKNYVIFYEYEVYHDEKDQNGIDVDIDEAPKDAQFKFTQIYLRRIYQSFLDSVDNLNIMNKTYDMLITDQPNFISVILSKRLNIRRNLYLSMSPLPQIFKKSFEFNPSYFPSFASDFSNVMSYGERCKNFFTYVSDTMIDWLSRYEIQYLFNDYGYHDIYNYDIILDNAMTLIQYPHGVAFPLSTPPNFVLLNALAVDEEYTRMVDVDSKLQKFMSKYENVVIVSRNIFYHLNISIIKEIVNDNSKYGFIFLRDKLNTTITSENIFTYDITNFTLSEEFKLLHTLLTENKILTVITYGNINEISISLHHSKPVVTIGNGAIHHNINSYIKTNMLGFSFGDSEMFSSLSYKKAFRILSEDDSDEDEISIYKKNAIKLSNILISNKSAKKEFIKWVKYGFTNGYETLNIIAYKKHSWFVLFGLDVFITFLLIAIIIVSIVIYGIVKIYKKCFSKKENKLKKD